jgi:hypothetical protein
MFDGKVFTLAEYEKIESAYIKIVLLFMDCVQLDFLKIVDLEKNGQRFQTVQINDLKINNSEPISKELIAPIIRLILRNIMWCKLESKEMYVHFGYDFYMYIGSKKACNSIHENIKQIGLFIEEGLRSPYLS